MQYQLQKRYRFGDKIVFGSVSEKGKRKDKVYFATVYEDRGHYCVLGELYRSQHDKRASAVEAAEGWLRDHKVTDYDWGTNPANQPIAAERAALGKESNNE